MVAYSVKTNYGRLLWLLLLIPAMLVAGSTGRHSQEEPGGAEEPFLIPATMERDLLVAVAKARKTISTERCIGVFQKELGVTPAEIISRGVFLYIRRYSHPEAFGWSVCPNRISLNYDYMMLFGGEFIAGTIVHELAHLGLCNGEGKKKRMSSEKNEKIAQKVLNECRGRGESNVKKQLRINRG